MFKLAERDGRKGITLDLKVSPGAKVEEFQGVHGDRLKVKVAAKAVEGAANTALLKFIAASFSVPLASVQLLSGKTGRLKTVFVASGAKDARGQEADQKSFLQKAEQLASADSGS